MATFVLVHGTWHGGWCWKKVTPLLRDAGHAVFAPTLTGLGARAHLLTVDIGLDTHIEDIVNLLKYEDLHDVILVGHSYGGMVVAGAAQRLPDRLAHLVYLDAMFPMDDDRSVRELQKRYLGPQQWKRIEIDENPIRLHEPGAIEQSFPDPRTLPIHHNPEDERRNKGWPLFPPTAVPLCGVTDPDDVRWLRERLTPHPRKTFHQRVAGDDTTDRQVPRTFVLCPTLGEPDWFAAFGRRIAREGGHYYELAGGHDIMVTKPKELSALLMRLASA